MLSIAESRESINGLHIHNHIMIHILSCTLTLYAVRAHSGMARLLSLEITTCVFCGYIGSSVSVTLLCNSNYYQNLKKTSSIDYKVEGLNSAYLKRPTMVEDKLQHNECLMSGALGIGSR